MYGIREDFPMLFEKAGQFTSPRCLAAAPTRCWPRSTRRCVNFGTLAVTPCPRLPPRTKERRTHERLRLAR